MSDTDLMTPWMDEKGAWGAPTSTARTLFDDYTERPEYFVVEDFCRLREVRGRMGVFTASANYAVADLVERIAEYSVIRD